MLEPLVSCRICGHQAQTLARHLKAAHGITADAYRVQFPNARIRSEACEANRKAAISQAHAEKPRAGLKKAVQCPCGTSHEVAATSASKDLRCPTCKARDKAAKPKARKPSPLKGRKLSVETRAKMAASAGWNRGLTKETDDRVARAAAGMKGRAAWSKGLTKADHPSLRSTAEKLSALKTGSPCTNGLKADLSLVDFTPYLDATGAVDRRAMAEELDLSEETVTKYMDSIGLRLSTKHVDARVERQVIRLTKEDLLPFALANGKVVIGAAMAALGRDFKVIKRECSRHGLPMFNRRIRQSLCLEAVSKVLGGAAYVQEWSPRQFVNPKTGHRFRFDGFFAGHDLIVEFHGYQHWTFPSVYIQDRTLFDAMVERDAEKVRQVTEDGRYHILVVREDEPYTDPDWLRQRLLDVLPV